jgi:Protein of unknown function (DUF3435)
LINTKAAAEDAKYKDFFNTVGDRIIEQNYQGKLIHFVPDVSSVLPGRRALADLEFKNRDANTVSDEQLLEDRIRSLEIRLALRNLEVPKALAKHIQFTDDTKFPVSMESKTGLECPVCLGRSNKLTVFHERML